MKQFKKHLAFDNLIIFEMKSYKEVMDSKIGFLSRKANNVMAKFIKT